MTYIFMWLRKYLARICGHIYDWQYGSISINMYRQNTITYYRQTPHIAFGTVLRNFKSIYIRGCNVVRPIIQFYLRYRDLTVKNRRQNIHDRPLYSRHVNGSILNWKTTWIIAYTMANNKSLAIRQLRFDLNVFTVLF